MQEHAGAPKISVLMPSYGQAAFVRRAIESLRAQTLAAWELIVVDDGSPDATEATLQPYLADARVRYQRSERNQGLGAALSAATALARGTYIAYLPSDDIFYPEHLAGLAALLDAQPDAALAYAGVRYGYRFEGPWPALDAKNAPQPFPEAEARAAGAWEPSGSSFSPRLVQVMHRREASLPWPRRDEIESDRLEERQWRRMLGAQGGALYSGHISCEWVEHFEQRHKLIASNDGGIARYRRHYGLGAGEWLSWQPSHGIHLDERARFARFAVPRALPAPGALKIALAGELGFNPERIMAFEERGHKLLGLWNPRPEPWDTTGPLPYGNIEDIPFAPGWEDRLREAAPDLIYALLNWHSLPLVGALLDAQLGIPLVFHFKEGPFICLERGLWPQLMRIFHESDGLVLIAEECRDWFQLATDGALDEGRLLILDGDLPKTDWFTDEWAPRLSDADGAIHTVCTGRPLGLDPFGAIAEAGIHVHFYGGHFQRQFPTWTREGLATGHMHLHETVEPEGWVRELSRYDAAWFHLFDSDNGQDLRRARWDDMNLPARMGTYAAAGLPWILKDNRGSRVAIQSIAQRLDIGVFFRDFGDLAAQLRERGRMAQLSANMRAARHEFAFDSHLDRLLDFFRKAIARRR